MAITRESIIQNLYSTTAAAVPDSNLQLGEIAINATDEAVFIKNTGGTVKKLSASSDLTTNLVTISTSQTVSGDKTFSGTVALNNGLVFEGATANDFETTLSVVDPTADNAITLPNLSGTVGLVPGSTTQVVYNNAGALGASASFTYDSAANTLQIDGGYIQGSLLGAVQVMVRNTTGSPISAGTPVYAVGYTGGRVLIAPADASDSAKMPAIGMVHETIGDNSNGHVTVTGLLRNINTSTYSINQTIYVASGGGFTNVRPTSPSILVQNMGKVVSVASNGEILVFGPGRTNDVPNAIISYNGIIFEGTTVDDYETTLNVVDPTADRSILLPNADGTVALTANKLSAFASTSSSELAGVISDETGTGALVFANTPTLVAPILGTPTSGDLSNCTNLPISTGVSGLASGIATFLGTPSSANLAAAITDKMGSGRVVFSTSPTLTTPVLGTATATSINKLAITAPATGSTLTIADGKTLTASNTLTFTGTDSASVAFGGGGTVIYNGGALGTPSSGTLSNCTGLPVSTGISGLGTGVATFLATPSSANLAAAVTDETGTGALVFANSPSFTTPALGSATATAITAASSDISINAAAGNNSVIIAPTGTGSVSVSSKKITNLATPTVTSDAATKAYVDSVAAGLNYHPNVHAATTTNLSATYDNGTSGQGAFLEGSVNGALGNIDNHAVTTGDRILVKDQSTQTQNGIYYIDSLGGISSKWKLIRATDADNSIPGQVTGGDTVYVEQGDGFGGTSFVLTGTSAAAKVLGTDPLIYTQFAGVSSTTAGQGLVKNINALDVNVDNSTLEINSDTVRVKDAGITNAKLSNSSVTVNGTSISLGSSGTVTANTTNSLTIGTGLSGTSFNGSAPVTIAIDTATVATLTGIQTLTNKTLNSPTLTTPILGTPQSGTLSNCTGLPISTGVSGLGTGVATFLATPSSANLAAAVTDETGSGALVFATSPSLTTPTIGVATATSINKVAITAPATGSTLTIADGKTITVSNTLTFTGTDSSSVAFGGGGTVIFSGGALGTPSSGTLSNCTGLPISTGVSGLGSGIATFLGTPSSANLASAVSDETGTGALVFANTPTLVTPVLGTPQSGNLANCNGYTVANLSGLGTGVATFLATPSSANLASAVTDETGTGALVFANTPTLVTPILGTPQSGTLSNCTGLPISTGVSGLGTGVATFLATPSSSNLAAAVTDETGTGALVFGTSPSITTSLVSGSASFDLIDTVATTVNFAGAATSLTLGHDGTASSTTNISSGSTLSGNTKTVNIGTGGASGSTTNVSIGSTSGGTVTVNTALVVSGNLTVNGTTTTVNSTTTTVDDPIITLGGDTAPSSDDNKDRGVEFRWHNGTTAKVGFFGYDDSTGRFTFIPDATNTSEVFGGTVGSIDIGDVFINGTASTGTGGVVRASTPTLVTPILGTPQSGTLSNCTGLPISTGVSGLGTGVATFLATPSSANLAAAVTDETGSGALVFATSPSLTTPSLGVATATSVNKVAITAPATSSTLTIADGKTLTVSNTLTFTGTDSSSVAFGAGGTVLYNGGALGTPSSGNLSNCTNLPVSTGISGLGTGIATFLGTPSSANLAAAVTDETGSGALVFGTSPSLTTPALSGETFSTSAAVTAGTNAQGQGALTSDLNIITTASSNPSGVTLPTATTGRRIVVVNKGANPINIYPASGGSIDGLSVNLSVQVPANGVMFFNASSATQWYSSGNSTFTAPALGTPSSGTLSNCTGLPVSTGVSGLGTGVATFLATPSSANLAAAVTDETGTGALVFANTPTLVTPVLGTPQSGTLSNCTGLPVSTGVSGLGTGVATFLGTPSSANLAAAVTDETGTGALVFANTPTLVTPILGTPTSGTLTNCTGYTVSNISGLGTGVATFLATPSSANLAAAVTDETGSGALVFATSPSLTTPSLGVATATSINKLTITAPATSATLTIANGKTLTASNTLTFTGTDSSSVAFGGGGTVLYNGGALGTPSSGTLSNCTGLPVSTGISGLGTGVATFLGTPSSANLAAAVTDETGTGALVFGTSPSITTSLVTGSASFDLVDATATTVNFAGAATTLNIGHDGTSASTTDIATGATHSGNTKTVNIGTGGASGSTTNINIGSGSGGTVTVNSGLTVSGNLTVNGTTTTVNSTTTTLDDPIITLGGDAAPTSDDNKDRGVEFRWHNGSVAKLGFFGYDDSLGRFIFIPDATNTSEVFSGALGNIDVGDIFISGTASTGTGGVVRATSPTLVTPVLGTPSSGTLSNCTGYAVGNLSGLGSGVGTFLATPSSANLASAVTDETGTGALVFANTPTLVTPILGTPTSGTLTNCTGYTVGNLSGLAAGVATFLATPSSANLASAVTDETGSGALVFATSPSLTTPSLGVATATSVNKVAITAPATSATLTIANGKTLTASNTLTFTGTDSSSVAFGGGGTVLYSGSALGTPSSGTLSNCTGLPVSTGISGLGTGVATFLGTPSSANLAAAVTDDTGTGALVFANTPTLVTPILGTPTSGTLTNCTGLSLATGVTGTLPVANGGTGQSSYTAGDITYYATGTSLSKLAIGSSGQVLTSSGSAPQWSNTSAVTWSAVTADQTIAVNTGVLANKSSGTLNLTLPSTAAVGTCLRVSGMQNTWRLAQNIGQRIHFGKLSTTTGTAGYLESSNVRDSIELVCCVANNEWNVVGSIGNIVIS